MLKPEQAKEALEKVTIPKWRKTRLAALAKLPRKLGDAGLRFLGLNAQGKELNWQERHKAGLSGTEQLDAVSARERLKFFETLFPKLASHLEAGWQLAHRLPYQTSYERKAFRAPDQPALTRAARGDWFRSVLHELEGFDQDIVWLAAWAPHLGGGYAADGIGKLLAAAVEAGGKEGDAVYATLIESARGEHDIGGFGRHVTRALLVAQRPEGWEFIEKMLLAAQRQEGLRQAILETIDEAHPEAFRRMLRLILEHDLARFSAVTRAVDVWFGFQWDSASVRVVNNVLERVVGYLEEPQAAKKALESKDAETAYLALWALAFENAPAAVAPAKKLLADKQVERRFVAVRLLGQLGVPTAQAALLQAMTDDDLRVALFATGAVEREDEDEGPRAPADYFERLEQLLARLPEKKAKLPPLVWPWIELSSDRPQLARQLIAALGQRSPTKLLPYLPMMDPWGRGDAVRQLMQLKKYDAATRDTLFKLVGDSSSWVRDLALQALEKCTLGEDEAVKLETLLTRKGDVRRAVLGLLLKQKDAAVLASAERALTAGKVDVRRAGLELLRQLAEASRSLSPCQARAEAYAAERPKLDAEETRHLEALREAGRPVAKLDDALGLIKPGERTQPAKPVKHARLFMTPTAAALLKSLDERVHEHRETSVVIVNWAGKHEELLGNCGYSFPAPNGEDPLDKDVERLPLRDVWEDWWRQRPDALRDPDGLELLRALLQINLAGEPDDDDEDDDDGASRTRRARKALQPVCGKPGKKLELRYQQIVQHVLYWLTRLHPPKGGVDFLLDAVETSFALVPKEELAYVPGEGDWRGDWRTDYQSPYGCWLTLTHCHQGSLREEWTPAHYVRLYHLLRWRDEPGTPVARCRPEMNVWLPAFEAGGATAADVFDHLLGARAVSPGRWSNDFHELRALTHRTPHEAVERSPRLRELVDRCRERILEVERERGETPTAASAAARQLSAVFGLDLLVQLLQRLGPLPFDRGRAAHDSKVGVFTHLVEVCHPLPADTPEAFAGRMRAEGFPEQRLLELAFCAPQWVPHVEYTLNWSGLAEGVWWFIAHTRHGMAGDDFDAWKALVSQRTPLSYEELTEGAVDVAWFQRVHEALGPRCWAALSEAAKFSTDGLGYRRAQFLTAVLLGKAKKNDLIADIRKKNSREAVRALGLLPLARGDARAADLMGRYKVLQEYHRYAKKLSALSKEGALQTAALGMANLARTAGYADPLRFEWAMETEAAADLAGGSLCAKVGDVEVTLSLDEVGKAEVTAVKGGKPLKSIPTPVRKNPKVAELLERRNEIKKQTSRMRQSLEQMMCRGETLTGAELQQLFRHPVLAPQLERLILVGEGIVGFPTAGGKALRDHAGKKEPVKKGEQLRLAHPHDLLQTGEWHLWQRDSFSREVVQPFKQVFRELYVLTEQEKADGAISRRYAGQQVNGQQATALWGSRSWTVSPEEGVCKTFHDVGLTAWVTFLGGCFTPAEVEGLTLEGVRFAKKGEWQSLPLQDVPPRLFSEVMRDLDLVVSVAHRGGVDPEASASTVEMRAALLRETCELLKINNIRIQQPRVLIDGELSQYAVHMGSGVVHQMPGGALCLVPVHAQHRGRLFLPFADDDPKTAEVLSKVILLARDREIQDPVVLEQIRARG